MGHIFCVKIRSEYKNRYNSPPAWLLITIRKKGGENDKNDNTAVEEYKIGTNVDVSANDLKGAIKT